MPLTIAFTCYTLYFLLNSTLKVVIIIALIICVFRAVEYQQRESDSEHIQ